MKYYMYNEMNANDLQRICKRAVDTTNTQLELKSKSILEQVKDIESFFLKDKEFALRSLTQKYDGCALFDFKVQENEFIDAYKNIDSSFVEAFNTAKNNIYKFHTSQLDNVKTNKTNTSEGVACWRQFTPIENVGLYIPAGLAPLFSTVLMLAIPANIAQCKNITITTPADRDGKISAEILYAAQELGIKNIFKIGGAQAIFALAYGTKTISKVDKIFGPGNAYVTAAKLLVSSHTAIDFAAGPSEVLIIADEKSRADFIAADILSQLEHGADSQAILAITSIKKLTEVTDEIKKQIKNLPRAEIIKKSLENSFAIICKNTDEAVQFSNSYAPEHLILSIDNYDEYINSIRNAGSVFCGPNSAESFGDYSSGTNHTLPTNGFARSCSGLSIESFGKWISFQKVDFKGLQTLGPVTEVLASYEKLDAHKNAISIRLASIN